MKNSNIQNIRKIGVYTDPQFYWKPGAYETNLNPAEVMREVVEAIYDQAYSMGVRVMLMPGDFVHFPKPNNRTIEMLVDMVKGLSIKYPDLVTLCIVGNHDRLEGGLLGGKMPPDTILHALERVSPLTWEIVENNWVQLNDTLFLSGIPFYRHETHFFQKLEEVRKAGEELEGFKILMTHQDERISGKSKIDPENPDQFGEFDMVFNGHIHTRYEYRGGTWINPGIPACMMEKDHSTIEKGWYYLEAGENLDLQFIPTPRVNSLPYVPEFRYYKYGQEVADEEKYHYIQRVVEQVDVEVTKVKDDTKEGRSEITESFLSSRVTDYDSENPEVLEYMNKVISKIPNLEEIESTTLQPLFLWGEGYRSWVDRFGLPLNPDQMTYIQAPVGSGKSAMFEILPWIWFGKTARNHPLKNLVSRDIVKGLAQDWKGTAGGFTFMFDGHKFEIIRTINYTGEIYGITPKSGVYCFQHVHNGQPTYLDAEFFGVDPQKDFGTSPKKTEVYVNYFLKGCTFDRFCNTVLFSSETAKLITGKEKEVRDMLEPMFNLGWVDEANEIAKADREVFNKEATRLRGQLTVLTRNTEKAKEALTRAKEAEEEKKRETLGEIDTLEDKVANNRVSLMEAEQDLPGEVEAVEQARKAVKGVEGINPYLKPFENLRAAYNVSQDKVTKAIEALNSYTPVEISGKENLLVRELEIQKKQVQELENLVRDLWQTGQGLKSDLDRAEKRYQTAVDNRENPDAEICQLCKQGLPEGHDHIKELDNELQRTKGELDKIKKYFKENQESHRTQTQLLETAKKFLETLKRDVEEIRTLRTTKDTQNRESLSKAVSEANEKARLDREKMNSQLAKVKSWDQEQNSGNQQAKKALKEAEEKVEETRQYIADLKAAISTQEEKLKILRSWKPLDFKEFIQAEKEAWEAEKKVLEEEKEAENKSQIYSLLISKVFTARGLKRTLMAKKLEEINELAREYMTATGTVISYEIDDNGSWMPYVILNGEKAPAATASSGQATTANLILVHCLADHQRRVVNIPLMILDEPFTNVDPDTLLQISKILEVGIDKGISKFVVTHSQQLDITNANLITVTGSNVEPSKLIL